MMNFIVKQINITNKTSDLFDSHNDHSDFPHGFILVSTVVLLPLVNSFRNAKTSKFRPDCVSQLPMLVQLNGYIIITTILLPLLTILGAICWTFKSAVIVWLRLRHKDKFKGLLSGPDTLWTLEDYSTSVVNILLVVRHESAELFSRLVIKKLQVLRDDPKLWKLKCGYSSCMGYTYLLTNQDVNGGAPCVHKLDSAFYANREVLQASLSDFASIEIGGGNLWEAYIGAEKIAWGNKRNCYPLIVRFHHVLGDGHALLQLIQKSFSPVNTSTTGVKLKPRLPTKQPKEHDSDNDFAQRMVKITIRIMHSMHLFYKLPQIIIELLSKRADNNCLHHPGMQSSLSGVKIVAWKVEKGYKYVNRVKEIKRRIGTAFIDIIAASVSYSLNKFFTKKNNRNVEHVNVVIPALPHTASIVNINASENVLTNRFSVGILKLPVHAVIGNEDNRSCYWRCAQTIANLYNLRSSFEFQINYWLMEIVMAVVPRNIMKLLLRESFRLSTLVISNLPGPKRIYLDEGDCESFVEDIVFWVPQRGLTGVSISIFTYDDRFQLGVSIDKLYGVTQQEAEVMLESIFDYIDRLHEDLVKNV